MYSMSGPSSSLLLSGPHQSWGARLAAKPGGVSATSASPSSSTSTEAQVSRETCIVGLPLPNNAGVPGVRCRGLVPDCSLAKFRFLVKIANKRVCFQIGFRARFRTHRCGHAPTRSGHACRAKRLGSKFRKKKNCNRAGKWLWAFKKNLSENHAVSLLY